MRRSLQISAVALGVLMIIGALIVGAMYIAGNTHSGRAMLERLTQRLTSGHVKVEGLAGSFPKHLFLERLELSDQSGIWLFAERVNLDWSPLALLGWRVQVDRLQVARLNMSRLPQSSSKPQDESATIPRIDAASVSVNLLELGPRLVGAPASLMLTGNAHLRSVQDMAITAVAQRLNGEGNYDLHLRFDSKRMDAALKLHEPASGPLENLLQLPGLGALAATVNLSGPRSAEKLDLVVEAGGLRGRAQGSVNLTDMSGDLAIDIQSPALTPRADLGWQSAVLTGRWQGSLQSPTADGHIAIVKLRLPGNTLIATAHADLSASGGKATLAAVLGGVEIPGSQPRLLSDSPLKIDASLRLDQATRPISVVASHRLFSLRGTAETAGMIAGKQNANVELRLLDLAPLAAMANQHVGGDALVKAVIKGVRNSTHLSVDATAALHGGTEFWSAAVGEHAALHVAGELTDRTVNLESLRLNSRVLTLAASGSASRPPAASAGQQPQSRLRAKWELGLSDLRMVTSALTGTLTAAGSIEGPVTSLGADAHVVSVVSVRDSPSGALSADITLRGLPSVPSGSIKAQGSLDGAPLNVDVALEKSAAGSLRAHIHRVDWRSAHIDGDVGWAAATAQASGGELRLQIAQLSDLQHLLGIDLAGSVKGHILVAPEQQRTHAHFEFDGQHIAVAKLAGNVQLSGEGFTDAMGFKVAVQMPNLRGSAGAVAAVGSLNLDAHALSLQSLTASYRGQDVQLSAPAKIDFANGVSVGLLKIGAQKAVLQLRGELTPALDLRATLRGVQPSLVNVLVPGLLESATIDARAELHGSLGAPLGEVHVNATGVRWGDDAAFGLPAFDLRAHAQLMGNTADLDARLIAGETSKLTVTGHAPLAVDGTLDLKIGGTLEVGMINPLLEARGQHATGQLAIDATVSGSVDSPEIGGTLNLRKGTLRDYGRGVNVSDITAQVVGSHGTLQIRSFTASAPPGTVTLTGTVGVLQKGIPIDITVKAHNAQPVVSKLVTANLDANLHVAGTALERLDVGGTVHFNRTLIGIPNSLPPNVAVLDVRRRGKKVIPVQDRQLVIGLDVTVQAPQEILVQGRGLDAEVGGDLHLGGTLDSPVVAGELALRRGSFALASSRLNFTAGSVTFNGADLRNKIDPNLDFTAQTSVGDVTAYLKISGPADAPQFEFTSNPAKQQEDVMALLLFGVPAANLTGLQLAQIAAALATLSGVGGDSGLNPLVKLQKSLGLDRLTVGAGTSNAAGTENTGASIEAGRYISRRVYVEAKQTTNGTSQLQADVDLTKHLTLQTRLGNGTATVQGTTPDNDPGSSVGLIYKFEY